MAGLRARQKADRERRILEAAVSRFRAGGYDETRIEEIAEAAEVSVGTVYNYFGSKGEILLAIVALEVTEVLAAGETLVADPPRDVAEALGALIGQYYDHSLVYLTKEMWQTAMSISILHPETPLGRRYTELDRRLASQVTAMIRRLQTLGRVRAGLDPGSLGAVIFNNLNMMFIEFAKDVDMTVETLKARVAVQNAELARLIAVPRTA